MNPKQPNFEKIKTQLYRNIYTLDKVGMVCLLEQSKSDVLLPSFHLRKETFKQDLDNWLDTLDIRCVGSIIDKAIELGCSLPKWMKDKKYCIDYNSHGFMDLVVTEGY